jgi:hypothetical protein
MCKDKQNSSVSSPHIHFRKRIYLNPRTVNSLTKIRRETRRSRRAVFVLLSFVLLLYSCPVYRIFFDKKVFCMKLSSTVYNSSTCWKIDGVGSWQELMLRKAHRQANLCSWRNYTMLGICKYCATSIFLSVGHAQCVWLDFLAVSTGHCKGP